MWLAILVTLLLSLSAVGEGAQPVKTAGKLLRTLPVAGQDSSPANEDLVIELTDDKFDTLVTAETVWMIEVFAQWCSHCRQLEPQWKLLAKELAAKGIQTGKIDGPKNKLLMTRFGISSFPAIFLLKGGSTWEYEGSRTVQAMQEFAESGHEKVSSLPFWKAPNSILGKAMGQWHRIPGMIKEAYTFLHEDQGLSELTIVAFFLAVPVVVGALSICTLDGLYLRQARMAATLGHEHAE